MALEDYGESTMGWIRNSVTNMLSVGATGTLLALGALGPSAVAQQVTSFGFTLTPSIVTPGSQVALTVSSCNAAYTTASSDVFDTVRIARGQTVWATVDRDAQPGAVYSVSFTCNGETGTADLTIVGSQTWPTTGSTIASTAITSTLGVRGGLGGSGTEMDPKQLGVGASLFLAAAVGTTYTLRRRASHRGH